MDILKTTSSRKVVTVYAELSFSCVTETGEGKMERARGEQDGKESEHI
jgi:hypothetical protein